MARYSDINRGQELAAAYVKLQAYRAQTRAQKVADYATVAKTPAQRVKSERKDAYIAPFGSDSATVLYEARVLAAAQTGVGNTVGNIIEGLVNDRWDVTLTATQEGIKVPKFKFAQIIGSDRTTTATANSNSRFTDTPYKRHRSENVSCPFGRQSAGVAESYNDAIKAIKAKTTYGTFESEAGSRIGFRAEG